MIPPLKPLLWSTLTLAILGGIWYNQRLHHEAPPETEHYHEQIRKAINSLPYTTGDWIGTNVPVPPAAFEILHTSTIFSRRFRNVRSGENVTVILIHCKDSRDILGHYPPVCYPGNGWNLESNQLLDLTVNQLTITATRYKFSRSSLEGKKLLSVLNFIILPDGKIAANLGAVHSASQDYRRKFLGVAQIQMLLSAELPDTMQIHTASFFSESLKPVIDAIWQLEKG